MTAASNSETRSAALVLKQAWDSGELMTELPDDLRPDSLVQGYELQDRFVAYTGLNRAGWKLGVGSPAQRQAGNLSRPLIGQVFKERCFPSGTQIALPPSDPVTIECEVALILDRDIAPGEVESITAGDIRSTCITFELVRSRFVDRRAVGWPSFVADNVGFEALVIGDVLCEGLDQSVLDRIVAEIRVDVDGDPMAEALIGDVATDPVYAVNALVAHARDREITLRAGEIVSTGASCNPFVVYPSGQRITAQVGDYRVEFTL